MQLRHPVSFEELTDYAFKGLKAKKGDIVQSHLATCTRCAAQLKRLRMVRQGLQIDDGKSPPAALYIRAQSIFATQPHKPARRFVFQPIRFRPLLGRAVLVTAILILLLGGFTFAPQVAAAANDSLPGDSTYILKVAGESITLALSFDTASRLETHLTFAQNRLTEIGKLTDEGRQTQVPATLEAFNDQVAEIMRGFKALMRENPESANAIGWKVVQVLSHSTVVLTALLDQVPDPAKPAIELAIEASQNASADVLDEVAPSNVNSAPPGQNNVPPGQAQTPPGQVQSPPGQDKTPPGQNDTQPGQNNVPPGQDKTPPGQDKTPPGQDKAPNPTKTPGPNKPSKSP